MTFGLFNIFSIVILFFDYSCGLDSVVACVRVRALACS